MIKTRICHLREYINLWKQKKPGRDQHPVSFDSHAVEASSSYKKSKQQANSNRTDQELCTYCGKSGHGKRNPAHIRRVKYPAYGHKCELCQRDHHVETMCRSKDVMVENYEA